MVFCRSGQLYKTEFRYLDFTANNVQIASLELTYSSSVFNMLAKKKKDLKLGSGGEDQNARVVVLVSQQGQKKNSVTVVINIHM